MVHDCKLAATLWWFTAAPKPLKIQVLGVTQPQGSHSPYILGDTTRPGHVTCVLVWSKSDRRRLRKTAPTNKQTDTTKIMVTWPWTNMYYYYYTLTQNSTPEILYVPRANNFQLWYFWHKYYIAIMQSRFAYRQNFPTGWAKATKLPGRNYSTVVTVPTKIPENLDCSADTPTRGETGKCIDTHRPMWDELRSTFPRHI